MSAQGLYPLQNYWLSDVAECPGTFMERNETWIQQPLSGCIQGESQFMTLYKVPNGKV